MLKNYQLYSKIIIKIFRIRQMYSEEGGKSYAQNKQRFV